jgi:hypothetical protein
MNCRRSVPILPVKDVRAATASALMVAGHGKHSAVRCDRTDEGQLECHELPRQSFHFSRLGGPRRRNAARVAEVFLPSD